MAGGDNTESRRLRDLESLTDAALSYLPLEELLDQLLTRVRDILSVDTAAVLLLEDDGQMLAARAAKGLEEEVERRVRIPVGRGFAGRVAAEGRPLIADVDRAEILNPILREKKLRSLLGVPLHVEGTVIGVLHVGTLRDRSFTDEDTALLQKAADRAALAISARLADRERGLAEALQHSLIPSPLPSFPGVSLAGRYFPAAAAPLGGDWYDAFVLPGGTLGFAIGDVVGRGIKAAALMGQLRSALRAYALEQRSPDDVVLQLNGLLRHLQPGESATLLYGVFDPGDCQATLVSAGHPPPMTVSSQRDSALLEVPPSVPLGTMAHPRFNSLDVEIAVGSTTLLYTDGLIERASEPLEAGLDRLIEAAGRVTEPERLCDRIVDELLPKGAKVDDAAFLAMRSEPLSRPLVVDLPADRASIPLSRRILGRWLKEAGVSDQDAGEIALGASEACANAIEHAYSPSSAQFRIEVSQEGDTVVVAVRDRGRWRSPRGRNRGRGMLLMKGTMDDVSVEPGPAGTTVTLRRRIADRNR